MAGPYEAYEARPGQIIENRVEITWEGTEAGLAATDRLEVGAFPFNGHLQIMGLNPDGTPQVFQPTAHSDMTAPGRFIPSPAPVTANGQPVAIADGPLRVAAVDVIRSGMPLMLVVEHQGLNTDASSMETLEITLSDRETGDSELLRLEETAPDSGVFAGAVNSLELTEIAPDGTISTTSGSRITASFEDPWRPGMISTASVDVAPFATGGMVFDSRTGRALDGVAISLLDAQTGAPAEVYGDDLTSAFPARIISGEIASDASGKGYKAASGGYLFPHVPPGRYYFKIEAPDGFTAPSLATNDELQTLPGAPFDLGEASHLMAFEVTPGQSLQYDIPLDGEGFLSVLREGSSDALGIGDFIRYEIRISTNVEGSVLGELRDTLPLGLHLLEKTIEIDGEPPQSKPIISSSGETLVIPGLVFLPGKPLVVSYSASVSAGAVPGDTLRSSSEASSARLLSNRASHDLEIEDSLSQQHDILLGRIRADGCGTPPLRQPIDLSGIRLILEDGRYAQSDAEGRFTFRRIARGNHVIAIDPLSLPRGWRPSLCRNEPRAAGSAMSRFVEAQGAFARQVTFHIEPDRFLDHPDPIPPEVPRSSDFDKDWISQNSDARGFVFPPEDHLPRGQSIDVVAARAPREDLQLSINGQSVNPLSRRPSVLSDDGRAMLDIWKGLPLIPGQNDLTLERHSQDGELISRTVRSLFFNETANRIEIIEDASLLESDGRSRPVVVLRISNEEGIPLHPGTLVKLMVRAPQAFSTITRRNGEKTEERSPSVTARVDADGLIRLRLAAPDRPGHAHFSTYTDEGIGEASAFIASSGHPWILSGLATSAASGQGIADHMRSDQDTDLGGLGGVHFSGRGAFFARGVLSYDWLLTMRYDSALHHQKSDFAGSQPQEDRRVFGDASLEGHLAASRDPIYLHLEGRKADILYGDFETSLDEGTATYSRRLTGARALYLGEGLSLSAFMTGSDQKYLSESYPADGTTGPFDLSSQDILAFSERLAIEVTDRRDPSAVIERRELRRGEDYDINYAKGRIFLRDPLSSRDSEMNPQALVIYYELEESRTGGVTAGGRATVDPMQGLTLGATVVHEDSIAGGEGAGELYGIDLSWQQDKSSSWSLAAGQSHQGSSGNLPNGAQGYAAEMSWSKEDERSTIEARLRSEDTTFGIDNQSALQQTVISADLEASLALGGAPARDAGTAAPALSVETALHAEENLDTANNLRSAELTLARKLGEDQLKGGLRVSTEVTDAVQGSALQAIAMRETITPGGRLRYSYGLEKTLGRSGDPDAPDRLVASAEWDASNRVVLKATSELVHDTDLSAGILGLGAEMTAWEGATLRFGALEAATSQGSHVVGTAGLRQEVVLSERTKLRFAFDHQELLFGALGSGGPVREAGLSNPLLEEGYTAISAGADLDRGPWRHEGMVELRHSETSDQVRMRAEALRSLSESREFGLHASFFVQEDDQGSLEHDHEIGASLAWRPMNRESAVLEQIDLRHDSEDAGAETRIVNALRFSNRLPSGGEMNLHHGVKVSRFTLADQTHTDLVNLFGAEYRHPLTDWLDAGVQGAALHSLRSRTRRSSLGASLGFTPFDNGWISIGYNGYGFRDDDFSGAGYLDAGAFIQFRLKFDSSSFGR